MDESRPPRLEQRIASRALIVLLVAGLVLLSVSVTLGHVIATIEPEVAATLVPCNGVAKATAARSVAFDNDATPAELTAARGAARDAIRCSPLIARALAVIGQVEIARGDDVASRHTLKLAERLSRRDLDAQLLLLEDSVKREQVGETLHHYDIALRTNIDADTLLFPTLAQAVTDSRLRPDVIALLRRSPPWADRFFATASEMDKVLPHLPQVLDALGSAFVASDRLNRKILDRLIEKQQFAPAQVMIRHLTGRMLPIPDRVNNGDFAGPGDWPPFDWEVVNRDGIGASINRADPGLEAFSGGGQTGVAAQQVVALSAGGHAIATEAETSPDDLSYASWTITCAGGSGRTIAALPIPATGERAAASTSFVVPENCPYQWLRLTFAAGEPEYRRLTIRSLTIEPAAIEPAPSLRKRGKRYRGSRRYRR